MRIGPFDTDKKVLVIAEIGNNHEGSFALAEKMIGLAAKAGADAVKFQTIIPEKLVSVKNTDRIEQLNRFQLSFHDFERLSKAAEKEKIMFLSTPFDLESAAFLSGIVPAFKIASGDNNFFPLLELVAHTGRPIILSTGISDLEQVGLTKSFIENIWKNSGIEQEMALLHCVANYPTEMKNAVLGRIKVLKDTFKTTVGYSDHTLGIEATVLSVCLGARIVEKHFTVDKQYSSFRDHSLSADPKDLAFLVERIKLAAETMGDPYTIMKVEKGAGVNLRRSIVAGNDLDKGSVITMDVLSWVRPGGGLAPGEENGILGKILKRSVSKGELILPEYF
ncbi:MAG: N-acetylneuraminate synthase family protein [Candidatus Omnitrophica bacterium]|nr:N-acetylneuraminate synthase family protein [Candidatus Omnitrophota bacterium]